MAKQQLVIKDGVIIMASAEDKDNVPKDRAARPALATRLLQEGPATSKLEAGLLRAHRRNCVLPGAP